MRVCALSSPERLRAAWCNAEEATLAPKPREDAGRPAVHSLKYRVKDADHLIAKIIRKRILAPDRQISIDNYATEITDLIGVRAMHLYKQDWQAIHEFVKETWDLGEQPTAYVRDGDPQELVDLYAASGCAVKEHPFGYRSVHYILKSQPAKGAAFVELQVRTIFEEAWSEIDHQMRYPANMGDALLTEFLRIFNRLAGSADEMGGFIRVLRHSKTERDGVLAEHAARERDLRREIESLKIGVPEKKKLHDEVDRVAETTATLNELQDRVFWALAFRDGAQRDYVRLRRTRDDRAARSKEHAARAEKAVDASTKDTKSDPKRLTE
jgi:ppGpp synthetase/RelA/SpoT-type nucleotidyltranferase